MSNADDEEIHGELRRMLGTVGDDVSEEERRRVAQQSDWLRTIYERLRADAQLNNDRVYAATNLYLPLALVPAVGLITTIERPRPAHALLLAVPSIGLVLVNLLVAQRETAVRDRYNAWVWAIQAELGLNTQSMKANKGISSGRLRVVVLVGLVVLWIVLLVAAWQGWLDHPQGAP